MSLESVRRPALSAEVIARLRERITSGDWPVGSRIPPEPELMTRLQVARGTLREAIRALAHAGLLDVRQGDGTYVRAVSELSGAVERLYGDSGLGHVLEVRQALDLQAARLAAVRAEEADLDALDEALRLRRAAWDARDFDAWIAADWDFHRGSRTRRTIPCWASCTEICRGRCANRWRTRGGIPTTRARTRPATRTCCWHCAPVTPPRRPGRRTRT